MVCTACGVANDAGRKFCKECGSRLALTCAECGAANAPDDKFCGECGVPLVVSTRAASPAAAVPVPSSSDTERRLVSVLFVDLVGFTSFSEGRDAEDVRAMLSHYFEAASDAVSRHGGSVEKFIGDAVMAVWGTPVAHEDDAERAVRSALEIVDRVRGLGASLDLPLSARAGVLTGEAVAVLGAVDQGFVTGDLVNTASRLQSAAEPGTVLVGERTYRSTSSSIAYEPVDALTLKGKAEQLPAWKALRLISELGGSNRGTAPEPPFGGRDEELRQIKELLHATGREGRPRLLHISGVAGIGKSRLVWELTKYTDGLTEDIYWHQGRCPSYGDGVSFWALAEMVRARAGIADTDDIDTAHDKLVVCLERFVPDDDERHWLQPRLGHLLGLESAPPGDRDELFGAWRRFVERVAEHGTVVLVVEELHWADPGLMDFLESLLEWSRTSPVLVLTLARPELMDRRPAWGVGVRNSSTLHLDRLDDPEIRAMVVGYVDGLPDDGLDRLVARAEGVPMYAVETVRMLADRGVLTQTGERYRAVGELGGELDIPETLHALVAARLDGLPDAERALVQDASVAGHAFTVATVAAVAGQEPAEIEPILRVLVRKEVLDQDVDPRSPERGQYRFVQSVIQEVAYSTLSKSARRAKHLACARRYEEFGEDDLAGVVASHYLEAYRAEPSAPDAEEIAAHARVWLGRAGARASSLGSHSQALGYAQQALSLAGSTAERADLHAAAAYAAGWAEDLPAWWEHLVAASDAYRAEGDAPAEARLLATSGRFYDGPEKRAEVMARLADVVGRMPEDQPAAHARALATLADAASQAGRFAQASDYSTQAIVLAQRTDDDEALAEAATSRAWSLGAEGRHFEGRLLQQAVVDLARGTGSPFAEARALLMLGVWLSEADPREALRVTVESAVIAGRAGLRSTQALALGNGAEGAMDLGEWDVAESMIAEARPLVVNDLIETDALDLTQAMLVAHREDPAAALADLARMESESLSRWHMVQSRSWFHRVRGLCRLLAADDDGAYNDAMAALELEPLGGNAPMAVWVAVQAACSLRDPVRLASAREQMTAMRGAWITAVRATADGAAAALTDPSDAQRLSVALDGWTALGMPLDHALATLCAVRVLPPESAPVDQVRAAHDYLAGLRATSLPRLLDEAGGRA